VTLYLLSIMHGLFVARRQLRVACTLRSFVDAVFNCELQIMLCHSRWLCTTSNLQSVHMRGSYGVGSSGEGRHSLQMVGQKWQGALRWCNCRAFHGPSHFTALRFTGYIAFSTVIDDQRSGGCQLCRVSFDLITQIVRNFKINLSWGGSTKICM
jgi:hypothetical protein